MIELRLLTGCIALFTAVEINAAQMWTDVEKKFSVDKTQSNSDVKPFTSRHVAANLIDIKQSLLSVGDLRAKNTDTTLTLPMPDGSYEKFSVEESPIMEAGLVDKYPDIKTYKIRGIGQSLSSGRIDITSRGFHAFIYTDKGLVYIDPVINSNNRNINQYKSFYKKDFAQSNHHLSKNFSCGVSPSKKPSMNDWVSTNIRKKINQRYAAKSSGGLYTYRLAVATTQQYSTAVAGGDVNLTMAAIFTAINRVNGILERDVAIKLILVNNNNLLINMISESSGLNSVKPLGDLLTENQTTIDSIIGSANYDVGHLFSTIGGGLASLGSVCVDGFKAEASSGVPNPIGDAFYIDILAHEFGHQFGADHTFNGTSESCGDINARNSATAFEPGSGNTIMAYAGICFGENVQFSADANYHAGSIDEIIGYTRGDFGGTCNAIDALTTTNASPTVNVGQDFIIPLHTPFTLSGTATDANDDVLSYQWQQMDLGAATNFVTFGTDLGTNPLFKSFPPVSVSERTIPDISTLLASVADPAEVLPQSPRVLNFRLLVRDGVGGVDSDDITVTTAASTGPFRVLQPNSSTLLNVGQTQVVKWDSACTSQAPINCANVDISYSTDGGQVFTTLLQSTPNDGEQTVTFLPPETNQARVKVMCSDNIFFDVSDVNFSTRNGFGAVLTSGSNVAASVSCTSASTSSSGSVSGLFYMISLFLAVVRSRATV